MQLAHANRAICDRPHSFLIRARLRKPALTLKEMIEYRWIFHTFCARVSCPFPCGCAFVGVGAALHRCWGKKKNKGGGAQRTKPYEFGMIARISASKGEREGHNMHAILTQPNAFMYPPRPAWWIRALMDRRSGVRWPPSPRAPREDWPAHHKNAEHKQGPPKAIKRGKKST